MSCIYNYTLITISLSVSICFFFFFQAEDGIRDYKVTGVQTCALPISERMRAGVELARALHPPPGRCRDDIRRALHGGALQVVHHAADAAHFLAAAGAPGTAVHQVRQW